MNQDYSQKIRNLLSESQQTVPYIFERFYTLFKHITKDVRSDVLDPKLLEHYSLIYRTIKKYITDEPDLFISQTDKAYKDLNNLLTPILLYLKEDVFSKKVYEYFSDNSINLKISKFLGQSQTVKQELVSKNLKLKVFGTHQLSNAFWILNFRNDYSVHVDEFWKGFLSFTKSIDFFQYFISESSKSSILKKLDPEKKYFVTSINVCLLFYKLGEPEFLEKLADETSKGIKRSAFNSQDFMLIKYFSAQQSQFETNLARGQVFEISGKETKISNLRTLTKHPPTVIFGSSLEADVRVKNKYVSRKQFMIIEEQQGKMNPKEQLNFSLVCLSSSNFTMVTYKHPKRLENGMIFKIAQNSIQVVSIANSLKPSLSNEQQEQNQQEQTLQYLPIKPANKYSDQKQLDFQCISGSAKNYRGKITKQKLNLKLESEQKSLELIYNDHQFYLPPETKILVKTANQVINGQLSHKLILQNDMKIFLQECQFEVL